MIHYGHALLDADQADRALVAFTRVLELEPRDREARLGIAQALFQKGEVSEAAVRAEAILAEDSSFAGAHILLSLLHLAEHDQTRAIEEYLCAVSADRSLADRKLESVLGLVGPSSQASKTIAEDSRATQGSDPESNHFSGDSGSDDLPPGMESEEENFANPVNPRFCFEDVGGLQEAKQELRRRWIARLENPGLAKAYKIAPNNCALLYGPPGCGKSMLAEAVAGEAGCRVIHVGIHEILDPYFGSSERNLYHLMEVAREEAPIVVIFDHVDTIAGDRQRLRDNQARNLANQFLHQLHLLSTSTVPVFVIGCTDSPWHVDRSFLRPGRFGQPIFVAPPEYLERLEILEKVASSRPVEDLNIEDLAASTRGFSGADLKAIFELASEKALGTAATENAFHLLGDEALKEAVQGITSSTNAWFKLAQKSMPKVRGDEAFSAIRQAVTDNRKA